jgi:hypothetical protein
MALVDAIANVITTLADGDLFYVGEDLTGSYQDGQVAASVIKSYVLTGPVAVVGSSAAGASIRLPEDTDNGSSYVALKAPDSLAATYTLTFPADDGASGEVLSTNGSGVLSWAAAGGGGGASAPLTLTGGINPASPSLTITETWNNGATTFTSLLVNATDTASAVGSKLLDLQDSGTSVVSVARNTTAANHDGEWRLLFGANCSVGWSLSYEQITFRNAANTSDASIRAAGIVATGAATFATDIMAGSSSGMTSAGWRSAYEAISIASDCALSWSSTTTQTGTKDTGLTRVAAGVIGIRGASTSAGGALNFIEQTAPAAPAAAQVVVYAEDNGSGKTRLMARFETGAAQQIAIEP